LVRTKNVIGVISQHLSMSERPVAEVLGSTVLNKLAGELYFLLRYDKTTQKILDIVLYLLSIHAYLSSDRYDGYGTIYAYDYHCKKDFLMEL
jgi:hypothetical protein